MIHSIKTICGALRNFVPFVQFKKREKNPWRSVNFRKPATLLKLTLLRGCFSRFLNCTTGTKSRNASHISNQGFDIFKLFQQLVTLNFLMSRIFIFIFYNFQFLTLLEKNLLKEFTTLVWNQHILKSEQLFLLEWVFLYFFN